MRLTIAIPEDVSFNDLDLERRANGDVAFDWTPIERIAEANGFDVAILKNSDEDNLAEIMIRWYAGHVASGGQRNAVADELWGEALSELN